MADWVCVIWGAGGNKGEVDWVYQPEQGAGEGGSASPDCCQQSWPSGRERQPSGTQSETCGHHGWWLERQTNKTVFLLKDGFLCKSTGSSSHVRSNNKHNCIHFYSTVSQWQGWVHSTLQDQPKCIHKSKKIIYKHNMIILAHTTHTEDCRNPTGRKLPWTTFASLSLSTHASVSQYLPHCLSHSFMPICI